MKTTPEFTEMLLTNVEFLRPFATELTRDEEEAKDLFQETVYRALANREKYHTGTNIRGWLYTIMKNIFINNYRRKMRAVVVRVEEIRSAGDKIGSTLIGQCGWEELQLKNIQKSIFELPAVFKKPFVLFLEGYKYQEIAAILEEPLGTVKSRIHFARKLLKAQIERAS